MKLHCTAAAWDPGPWSHSHGSHPFQGMQTPNGSSAKSQMTICPRPFWSPTNNPKRNCQVTDPSGLLNRGQNQSQGPPKPGTFSQLNRTRGGPSSSHSSLVPYITSLRPIQLGLFGSRYSGDHVR